jgi:hypothetical protein
MAADILEAAQDAVAAAYRDDAETRDVGGNVAARVGNIAGGADLLPALPEDAPPFTIQGIGGNVKTGIKVEMLLSQLVTSA